MNSILYIPPVKQKRCVYELCSRKTEKFAFWQLVDIQESGITCTNLNKTRHFHLRVDCFEYFILMYRKIVELITTKIFEYGRRKNRILLHICTVYHFPENLSSLTTGNTIFKFKMEGYDYSLFKSRVSRISI